MTVTKTPPTGAHLAGDAAARKAAPIASGVLFYFPNALAAVANLSHRATQQHHPGEAMHWDFSKSSDEADCIVRHLAQSGTIDTDGIPHSVKVAWRALALVERELLVANPGLAPGLNVRGVPGRLPEHEAREIEARIETVIGNGVAGVVAGSWYPAVHDHVIVVDDTEEHDGRVGKVIGILTGLHVRYPIGVMLDHGTIDHFQVDSLQPHPAPTPAAR
jgi:hypothetical protein